MLEVLCCSGFLKVCFLINALETFTALKKIFSMTSVKLRFKEERFIFFYSHIRRLRLSLSFKGA